jgi:ankyrin repeat protein
VKSQLIAIVAAVLVVGCGPSAPDISIHKAVFDGNIEAVKQHLAAGTDMNAKISNFGTPLLVAAEIGHKEIAELLITKGADVNAKDGYGSTPLHAAAYEDHKEIAELLIASGADVNAKKDGTTPLHQAVFSGYKEMAEMLIAKGADVNAKDKHGETPLNWVIDYNQADLADLLRKHGGKTGEELKAEGK